MSRKSKSNTKPSVVLPRLYLFVVADERTGNRVIVAAPVFFQLLRRGWAIQKKSVEHRRDKITGQPTEERVAVLVDWLSFRSLTPSPDGNLCFKSLLLADGVKIESSWNGVERAWTQHLKKNDFIPQTWQGRVAVFEMRQDAIWEECKTWGVPELEPVTTGCYATPEEAALAIQQRATA